MSLSIRFSHFSCDQMAAMVSGTSSWLEPCDLSDRNRRCCLL